MLNSNLEEYRKRFFAKLENSGFDISHEKIQDFRKLSSKNRISAKDIGDKDNKKKRPRTRDEGSGRPVSKSCRSDFGGRNKRRKIEISPESHIIELDREIKRKPPPPLQERRENNVLVPNFRGGNGRNQNQSFRGNGNNNNKKKFGNNNESKFGNNSTFGGNSFRSGRSFGRETNQQTTTNTTYNNNRGAVTNDVLKMEVKTSQTKIVREVNVSIVRNEISHANNRRQVENTKKFVTRIQLNDKNSKLNEVIQFMEERKTEVEELHKLVRKAFALSGGKIDGDITSKRFELETLEVKFNRKHNTLTNDLTAMVNSGSSMNKSSFNQSSSFQNQRNFQKAQDQGFPKNNDFPERMNFETNQEQQQQQKPVSFPEKNDLTSYHQRRNEIQGTESGFPNFQTFGGSSFDNNDKNNNVPSFGKMDSSSDFSEKKKIEFIANDESRFNRSFEISNTGFGGNTHSGEKFGLCKTEEDSKLKNAGNFSSERFSWSPMVRQLMNIKFGIQEYRKHQKEAINATLSGKDVFIVLPTGGGKSLCYMLPGVINTGVTFVISPLLALIEDQIYELTNRNIRATSISSRVDLHARDQIYSDLRSSVPTYKFVYMTPELLCKSDQFRGVLNFMYRKKTIARFVVDESHCVSTWGHQFRKDYQRIGGILCSLWKNVPIIALTATATTKVEKDIISSLKIENNCACYKGDFNRPNLNFLVFKIGGKGSEQKMIDQIFNFVENGIGNWKTASGIIYCFSKRNCEDFSRKLNEKGMKTSFYHGGLNPEERKEVYEGWMKGFTNVICATIAFGMGINKSNVKFVVHTSMPKSIEQYYQEAGRCARDGSQGYCLLFYKPYDKIRILELILTPTDDRGNPLYGQKIDINNKNVRTTYEKIYEIERFCEVSSQCRRQILLGHFADDQNKYNASFNARRICNGHCDVCVSGSEFLINDKFTKAAKIIFNSLQAYEKKNKYKRLPKGKLTKILRGSKAKDVKNDAAMIRSFAGKLSHIANEDIVKKYISHLIYAGYIDEELKELRRGGRNGRSTFYCALKAAKPIRDEIFMKRRKEKELSNDKKIKKFLRFKAGEIQTNEKLYRKLLLARIEVSKKIFNEGSRRNIESIIKNHNLQLLADNKPTTCEGFCQFCGLGTEYVWTHPQLISTMIEVICAYVGEKFEEKQLISDLRVLRNKDRKKLSATPSSIQKLSPTKVQRLSQDDSLKLEASKIQIIDLDDQGVVKGEELSKSSSDVNGLQQQPAQPTKKLKVPNFQINDQDEEEDENDMDFEGFFA